MIETSEINFDELDLPPVSGRKEQMDGTPLVEFNDDLTVSLGDDPLRQGFKRISEAMLRGDYYPEEIISFQGRFRAEGRALRPGDRILQLATFPFLPGYRLRSVTEVTIAELAEDQCTIGYATTSRHFARGWWQAQLSWEGGELKLTVQSQARPNSLAYWLGIPIARSLQLRARKAAIDRFSSWV